MKKSIDRRKKKSGRKVMRKKVKNNGYKVN